jgi:methylmalonyl-CoA mutase N-terminal domain/subunit
MGGTQSLHTNGYDEALALPTEDAARLALRTQQVIAYESGVPDTVDPLAGSYYLEALTNELEAQARTYLETIDEMGGMLAAIEQGYAQREIQEAAYQTQLALERREEIVVGVNRFVEAQEPEIELLRLDPAIEATQREKLAVLRARRDPERVAALRARLAEAARGDENLMPLFIDCVESDVTLGEMANTLREVWGEYRPTTAI